MAATATINFQNLFMADMGARFPDLQHMEMPLYREQLVDGNCYYDVDTMGSPGDVEGRTDPYTMALGVTVMPMWTLANYDAPALSQFRAIIEEMMMWLKLRSWDGTGTIWEVSCQQFGTGRPGSPTSVGWEISFQIEIDADLDAIVEYPENVTPVPIRSITNRITVER